METILNTVNGKLKKCNSFFYKWNMSSSTEETKLI